MSNDGDYESEEDLHDKIGRVIDENKEGLESLAAEEPAEKKRSENILRRIYRRVKRKLGLRESEAKVIQV